MKKIIIFVLAMRLTAVANAQYEPQWQLGFPEYENLNIKTSTTFEDGYAMLGSFTDTITVEGITLCSRGGTDVLLMHLDTLGMVRRIISFGNENDDIPSAMFNRNDTLYICGQTATDSLNELFIYSFDVLFRQLSDLVLLFDGKIQTDILRVWSDKLLIGGSMKGAIMIGSQFVVNNYNEHAFFIELSPEGELMSSCLTSGNGLHRLHSLVAEDNSDYVLMLNVGKGTLEMPNSSLLSFNGNGVVAVRYDSVWNMKSRCVFDCTGFVEATDMIGNETGYVMGLNYNGTLTFDEWTFSSQGSFSSLLIQFDMEGNPIWISEIGSDDYCRLLDIESDGETIICTGYHYGQLEVESEILSETIERNTFLLAFDNEGRLSWHIDVDGIDADMGQNIVCEHNSVMLNGICQTTASKSTSGIVPTNNRNSTFAHKYALKPKDDKDMYDDLMTLENNSSSFVANLKNDNTSDGGFVIEVYPNPVKSVLHWNTNRTNRWVLELYDVKGVLLAQKCYDGLSDGYFDLSSCKAGVYIIRLSSAEGSGQRVIIKD